MRLVVAPRYFPVDEEHETRCEEIYSTTKWLGEELAAACARRSEVQIASLRYTWVMDEGAEHCRGPGQHKHRRRPKGTAAHYGYGPALWLMATPIRHRRQVPGPAVLAGSQVPG